MLRRTLAAFLALATAGCGHDGVDQPVQPGIDILPAATGISITRGSPGTMNVAVRRDGGYAGSVTLTLEAAPAGVTGALDPATLPNGTTTSVLTLTVASTAAEGTAPVTVRARGTGVTDKTATIQLTVTRPTPSTGAITWKFCDPVIRTIWLAVQDGTTGAWKQIIPASDAYHFDVSQAKGAVAWTRELVPDNFVTQVFYGTPDEIATVGAVDCLRQPAGTKTLTGTVTGFTPFIGTSGDNVRIGTVGAGAVVTGTTFQMFGVPDGPRDFIATRVSHTFANGIFNDTLTKLIVRRGIDATGSLEPFDFNGPEAVAPAIADLTVNGTNGEPTTLFMSYFTGSAAPPTLPAQLYAANLGTATAAPLYTVPFPLQRDGDLHALTLLTGPAINPGGLDVSGRQLTRYFSAPENQTLTLGPPLTIPTTTAISGSPTRFRVQAPVQSAYDHVYIAEWVQLSNLRIAALITTSAYAGGGAWDMTIPDLTAAGWDPSWGLRAAFPTETFFSAEGSNFPTTVPSGAANHGIVLSASRTTLPPESSVSAARLVPLLPARP
jgi:hypothetical protein